MHRSNVRPAHRFLRDRRGVSAVEFGLTAPILFLVVSGTLDMAQGYYVNTVLQGAVNAAARKSSLQSGATDSATLDSLVSAMIKYAMPKATVSFTRKTTQNFRMSAYQRISPTPTRTANTIPQNVLLI